MVVILSIFIFIFGAIFGSFLNCLSWRLYHQEGLGGRSRCPKCRRQIVWYDNIPLVSFLVLRGRCRHCRQGISRQYWLVELVTALLFLAAFFVNNGPMLVGQFFNGWQLWLGDWLLLCRDWLVISFLVIIFITDYRWYVILDEVSLPAIVLILAVNLGLGFSWLSLLSAAVVGASFFALQYVISRGAWIGGGDIRLGALMGVILGWPNIVVALLLAYFSGALIGLGLIALRKKQMKSPVPFGVFLAPATLVALWWGTMIWQWYVGLLF